MIRLINLEANVRDYQKILEQQILKLNYGSFTQVVILVVHLGNPIHATQTLTKDERWLRRY